LGAALRDPTACLQCPPHRVHRASGDGAVVEDDSGDEAAPEDDSGDDAVAVEDDGESEEVSEPADSGYKVQSISFAVIVISLMRNVLSL